MKTTVKQTETIKDSQKGDVLVVKGKLILIDAPKGGHNNMIATGRLINGIPLAQIPIIISETEEIGNGDWLYYPSHKNKIFKCDNTEAFINSEFLNSIDCKSKCFKILTLPENFSSKHLQDIVDGKLKDGDEVFVECYNKWEEIFIKIGTNKLDTHNYITLHKVEEKLYTRKEIYNLITEAWIYGEINKDKHFSVRENWIKNNLK